MRPEAAAEAAAAGRLDLAFARSADGLTFIERQYAAYPFHLCAAHRFEGDPPGMATVYLQSSAGGIYEDDDLNVTLEAGPGAEAHVTTPAATIARGMTVGARQTVAIEAREGAFLEYLPDPVILFPGARLASRLAVRADEGATVLASDSFLSHDPAGRGAMFERFHCETAILDREGRALACDRFEITGALLAERLPGLNGDCLAQGTLYVIHRVRKPAALVEALRRALAAEAEAYAGASALPNGCGAWARVLAADGAALKAAMHAAWAAAREALTGTQPAPRRK